MNLELSDLPALASEVRDRIRKGEGIHLTESGVVVANVIPRPSRTPGTPRRLGFGNGTFLPLPADFNDPLPDAFWHGGEA